MWSLGGCCTLLIFCGAMILSTTAANAGYPVVQTIDSGGGETGLMKHTVRCMMDDQRRHENPGYVMVSLPCEP